MRQFFYFFTMMVLCHCRVFSQRLSDAESDAFLKSIKEVSTPDSIKRKALSRLITDARLWNVKQAEDYTEQFKQYADKPEDVAYYNLFKAENAYIAGDYGGCIPFAEKAARLFKSTGNMPLYLGAMDKWILSYISQKLYMEALDLTKEVLEDKSLEVYELQIARIYSKRAMIYSGLKQYPEAIKDFEFALKNYRKKGNGTGEVLVYFEMLKVLQQMGDYASALDYANKIFNHQSYESLYLINKVLIQNTAAFIFIKSKRYNEAIKLLNKAREALGNQNPRVGNSIEGNLALAYNYLGKYDSAFLHGMRSFKDKKNNNGYVLRDVQYVLGNYHFEKKNLDSAKVYYNEALALSQIFENIDKGDLHSLDIMADLKKKLSKIELQHNNVQASITLLEEGNKVEQKRIEIQKSIQLNKAVNSFELKERKREVNNLTKQQLKSKLEIKDQQNRLILVLAGFGLLVVVFIFTYRSYVLKKKNAIQLEEKKNIIENQNKELEDALAEKGILLKEIHHRVKNNFQMIISLLRLQAEEGATENVDAFLEEATTRILSMSIIHQKLYESEDLSAVDFKEYVDELTASVYSAFQCNESDLQFFIEIPKTVFEIQTAIPLGLILNEMIINTIKYVYSTVAVTEIHIGLEKIATGTYVLSYFDNGIKVEPKKEYSFGMELITLLVDQLGGTISSVNSQNVHYTIQFTTEG